MTTLVRSIGATERLFCRYNENKPVHFSMIVEFAVRLDAAAVRGALDAVQRRHPLLSVHVEDRPGSRLGFYRADEVGSIPLTVFGQADEDWRAPAAAERVRPLSREHAPLMRATLAHTGSTSTLILTFDHTVADGMSSIYLLNDLVAALNGRRLSALPVPDAVEDAVTRALPTALPAATPSGDPRMQIPTKIHPSDGMLPQIGLAALTGAETRRLVERCRAEQTTVHAALVVASSLLRAFECDENFVRVMSPINVREQIGLGDDFGLNIIATVTGVALDQEASFWERARGVTDELAFARSAQGVAAASAAMRAGMGVDAECADAERLLTEALPSDMLITNLGVQNLISSGPIAPVGVWGPVCQEHIVGEYFTGVVTYQGRLRMATCGLRSSDAFLDGVQSLLMNECR